MLSEQLAEFDAAGLLAGCGESAEEYLDRIAKIRLAHAEFDARLESGNDVEALDGIVVRKSDVVPPEFYDAPAEMTDRLYGFSVRHVPGFFLTHQVGLLWGGCLVGDPDRYFSLFLLRNAFRKRDKWFFYRRDELLAHELCHSARQPLGENTLEEFFAYQTSPSRLRRNFGNCFIRDRDAILFVLAPLLVLAAEIVRGIWFHSFPSWVFWCLTLVYPSYLLIRNHRSLAELKRAERTLGACGVAMPLAVLFRCTRDEIGEIAALEDAEALDRYAAAKAAHEVRWQIITERFLSCTTPRTP